MALHFLFSSTAVVRRHDIALPNSLFTALLIGSMYASSISSLCRSFVTTELVRTAVSL